MSQWVQIPLLRMHKYFDSHIRGVKKPLYCTHGYQKTWEKMGHFQKHGEENLLGNPGEMIRKGGGKGGEGGG